MKVSEIFEQLSQGELRPLAMGGANESGILESDWPKVVPHINLALAAIHKRFSIRTKSLDIQLYDQISNYILDPRYAVTNTASSEPIKYIQDSRFQPFTDRDEILRITKVFFENGEEAPLNDETQTYSIFTPTQNSLQVPFADGNNAINVQYRANHPKIIIGGDLLDQDIDINYTYIEPLLMFVGARLFASQNSDQGNLGSQYMSKYELACRVIENNGLIVKSQPSNQKLVKNGWI